MAKKLLFPADIERVVRRRYELHHADWLVSEGSWPLTVALGKPLERDMGAEAAQVRAWVEAWRSFRGPAEVRWEEVRWPRLGAHQLPAQLAISDALQVARWLGEHDRYQRAVERRAECAAAWPTLASARVLARMFEVLADYSDADWSRLTSLLRWLLANPRSGHTVRTIPVEGLDTKWLDASRRPVLESLLRTLLIDADPNADFHELAGLSPLPARARLRVLCPVLRAAVGGLCDLEAPFADLARLPFAPAHCLIVENLESGLALADRAGCVAFVGLGNGVVRLAEIPWLSGVDTLYWGDLDTHGFAILHRARVVLGAVRSVLMDAATLLRFRAQWGKEPVQNMEAGLASLTPPEREVLDGLRAQQWGHNVRLEQERIPWEQAWEKICAALAEPGGAERLELSDCY